MENLYKSLEEYAGLDGLEHVDQHGDSLTVYDIVNKHLSCISNQK